MELIPCLGRREETSKFTALSMDVSIIMKSALFALSLSELFVIKQEISLKQSPSSIRERSVSALDKDIYTIYKRA